MSDLEPDTADSPTLSDDERKKLEAIPVRDPDDLLRQKRGSIIVMALVLSVAAHVALIGLTSFPLFADWKTYGVHMPARLDELKEEEAEKKRLAEQQAKLLAKKEEAAREEASKPGETNPEPTPDPKDPDPAKPDQTKPPEGDTEDPLKKFDLNDSDLGL